MNYDKVEANVRGLEALAIGSDTYGSLLVPVMMNKLPEELRFMTNRHFESGIWHLDKLLKSFKEEVEARERCSFTSRIDPMKGALSIRKVEVQVFKLLQHLCLQLLGLTKVPQFVPSAEICILRLLVQWQ